MQENIDNKNKWIVTASVVFGALMAAVDSSIMNIAIPHLRGVFSATNEEISWVITGYLITTAVTMPLTVWFCGRFGRKKVFLIGIQLFTISSIMCGLTSDLTTLVLARMVQGIGAGILLPTEQVILRETFSKKEQGLAMGIYGLTIMLGPIIGLVLGGYIIDNMSWEWIFYINIPIGIIGYVMICKFIHDPSDIKRHKNPVDFVGIILFVICLFAVHVLLEKGGRLDWFESLFNVILLFISIASLAMFIAHEIMIKNPAVNIRILRNYSFFLTILMSGIFSFVIFATLFILPIFMQDLLGFSATQSGLALVPRALVMLIAFPIVGLLFNKISPKILIFIGLTIGFYSSVLMAKFNTDVGMHDIIFPQILQGVAIAFILTPISTMALMHVKREELGAAAGLNNLSRQLGGSIGVVVFASLISRFENLYRGDFIHNIVLGDYILLERLPRVIQYFWSLGGLDGTMAIQRGITRLNGRFQEQVMANAFAHSFAWIAILFLVLIIILYFIKVPSEIKDNKNR